MPEPQHQPLNRSPRRSPRRSTRAQSPGDKARSSSPVASPRSLNVDRGRSRVRGASNPLSEDSLRRRGYHSLLSSFGKVFHVEKRWKLIREMGSGAYGVVISAADEISGETVAIKLVTRVFEKIQLAKRALREITLLRHFASHENITGLIDVDAISPDFSEIYIFMEPMEADLHQIIKSGQTLTNEHVQYFLYQILRGMKYVHSASVIHRDLKPGNLLVNADCELKICDFGLSRGFESRPDEERTHLTEYVATRWYRAPEIMLAFRRYHTAIDVWSIGCILAELLLGRPLFKGKDYVDQLNKVLDVLGTPEARIIEKIGSEKAQAYIRSLPLKKTIPFSRIIPTADPLALDLLTKMLAFDPDDRITVPEALEHPWLASYHDITDEPECPVKFDKWRQLDELETLEEYREAIWNEIEDYRREVRGISDLSGEPIRRLSVSGGSSSRSQTERDTLSNERELSASASAPAAGSEVVTVAPEIVEEERDQATELEPLVHGEVKPPLDRPRAESLAALPPPPPPMSSVLQNSRRRALSATPTDPVVSYARRSSIMQPSRQGSIIGGSPVPPHQNFPSFTESPVAEPSSVNQGQGSVVFPSQGYVVPARSRQGSTAGGDILPRRLLRTLSTVSIHETAEGLPGGLAEIAPIGKYILGDRTTTADAPPSEMPRDFAPERNEASANTEKKEGKFHLR